MYCTQCGKELGADGKCHNPSCKTNLDHSNNSQEFVNLNKDNSTNYSNENMANNNPYAQRSQNPYAQGNNLNVSLREFATFVGPKNTEYYMDKFEKYEMNQSFASWNWAAFFLNIYWMLYRKMYKVAAIVVAIKIVAFFVLGPFAPIVSFAIAIGIGVYGNLFYIKDCINKISNIKRFSSNINEADYNNRLMINGGTNLAAPLIIIGILVFIIFITLIFVGVAASSFYHNYYYY